MTLLEIMIFKNGFWVQRVVTDGRCRVLINPTALLGACEIDIFAKFLLTLINNKWPLGIDPGGHHFVVLNVSINKKPVSFSEVVTFSKSINAHAGDIFQLTAQIYLSYLA